MSNDARTRRNAIKRLSSLVVVALAGSVLVAGPPARAQAALSQEQVAVIRTSLLRALEAARGDATAIELAISQTLQAAVAQYGVGTAGQIASVILVSAEQAGVAPTQIGNGLAQAAAAIAPGNNAASASIATTVANEATTAEIESFQATATRLGFTNLASIAGTAATPTGETGGRASNGTGGSGLGGGGGQGSGCLNPSCTKL